MIERTSRFVRTIEEFNIILRFVNCNTPIIADVNWEAHQSQGYSLATHSFIEDLPDCIILRTTHYNFDNDTFIFNKTGLCSNVYYDPEQVAIISDSEDYWPL